MKISLCSVKAFEPLRITATGERKEDAYAPKVAIVALVKWLEKHGYPREMIDFYDIDMLLPTDAEIDAYFRELQPDIIGLSAILASCYTDVRRVAAIARRACPNAWIVMGGHLAAAANVVLRKTEVDVCVAGDGEVPLLEFVRYVERRGRDKNFEELARIPGLAYLDADAELHFNGFHFGVNEADLVAPDYDLLLSGLKGKDYLLENYFSEQPLFKGIDPELNARGKVKLARILPSKGCVAKCTFCQRSTKGYRTVPLDVLEKHLIELKERFGVNAVLSMEENFGSNIAHTYEFVRLLKKHDILMTATSARVTTFKPEDCKFIAEHNVACFSYGLESGSQLALDIMEKKITTEKILTAYQDAVDAGLFVRLSNWLVGNPGDTEQTVMDTGKLCAATAHILGIHPRVGGGNIGYVMPVPGTPIYEYGQRVGAIPTDVDGEEAYLLHIGTIRQPTKSNYTNINGAHESEVAFWDILMRMEASRTYRELCRKSPPKPTPITEFNLKYLADVDDNLTFNEKLYSMYWMQDNALVEALPRWLIYPVVKYLNYGINVVGRRLLKQLRGQKSERFSSRQPKTRYSPDAEGHGNLRSRSLRGYLRQETPKPLTKTEESRLILLRGL
ncbi:MAG: B12-binding domain-containing radical SAM protein [Magnetospirillum sp.]|nr:MAG: B12-binding domain-containing radical SAM protein [Magnetospirillum sp.]